MVVRRSTNLLLVKSLITWHMCKHYTTVPRKNCNYMSLCSKDINYQKVSTFFWAPLYISLLLLCRYTYQQTIKRTEKLVKRHTCQCIEYLNLEVKPCMRILASTLLGNGTWKSKLYCPFTLRFVFLKMTGSLWDHIAVSVSVCPRQYVNNGAGETAAAR
jgi:hypothetical protein